MNDEHIKSDTMSSTTGRLSLYSDKIGTCLIEALSTCNLFSTYDDKNSGWKVEMLHAETLLHSTKVMATCA